MGDGRSTGRCQPGTRECGVNGVWAACGGEVIPEMERCEGADRMLDYDCDGTPANGCDCNAGEVQPCLLANQVGACQLGQQTCDEQTNWGECEVVQARIGQEEVCNLPYDSPEGDHWMFDEDCDGNVDEGFMKVSFFSDNDMDDYGINEIQICPNTSPPEGYARNDNDCNDLDPNINPSASDDDCNAIDDDCDGTVDEGFSSERTTCGVGACSAMGRTRCMVGRVTDTCEPRAPADNDRTCDGTDNDCDGMVDEDYQPADTSCGVGACGSTGRTSCVGGRVQDSCMAGSPMASDGTCDGMDDDCDGEVDENFISRSTTCGVGACASTGMNSCVSGVLRDSCMMGSPAANDATCDGMDDDCDGRVDEHYVGMATTCGVGVCARTGMQVCMSGSATDSCTPVMPPTRVDNNCNEMDDDCDGMVDENGGTTYQWDNDRDGYLRSNPPDAWVSRGCAAPNSRPSGASANGQWTMQSSSLGVDCDDDNAAVNPGASDLCGLDLDCDSSNDPWAFCNCGNNPSVDCMCRGRTIGGRQYILCEFLGTRAQAETRCGAIATRRGMSEDIRLGNVATGTVNTQVMSWMDDEGWSNTNYPVRGAFFGIDCGNNPAGVPERCRRTCDGVQIMYNDFPSGATCNEPTSAHGIIGRIHSNETDCDGRRWSTADSMGSAGFLCQVYTPPTSTRCE